jgi:hypothetical protein
MTYDYLRSTILTPIQSLKKLFLQLPVNNKDMANFEIKETTHVTSTISSTDHKDLNDAFEAAVNHLGIHGGSVRITMTLDLVRRA